jgi:hypothetical protein
MPGLTIFALPKAFKGQFDNIQVNAIRSWASMDPTPEIILFGDDPGTAEAADRFGCRHILHVDRNSHGTPRIDTVMSKAQETATNELVCYVNSDIILPPDFVAQALRLDRLLRKSPFMGIGRKTSLVLTELLPFDDPGWPRLLAQRAIAEGTRVTWDSDYFLFHKGHLKDIPPFAVGRCYWTQWFMFDTRRRDIAMVDMSPCVLAVEPRHDYSHASSTGHHPRLSGAEFRGNRRLFKGCKYFTTLNATGVLDVNGIHKPPSWYGPTSRGVRLEYWIYFLLKGVWYPYSTPLIVLGRTLIRAQRGMFGIPRRLRRSRAR